MRRLAVLAALGLLAASCATVPPPRPVTAPPARPVVRAESTVVAAPVPPASGPLRLDREPDIRVGLAWDLDSLTITPVKPVSLLVGRADSHAAEAGAWEAGRPITFLCAGDHVEIAGSTGADVRTSRFGAGDTLRVLDVDGTPPAGRTVVWNGRHWRGELRLFVNPRGRLTLVSLLPLETYLAGVVPGEIGGLSPKLLEAGRAQAVAARSYTLFYRGRRGAEGFDIYGTVEDQVYGPVESERPLATQCVESTRGEVMLHDGQPIRANYCADCGGITAEVGEAWPAAPAAYLESRRDRDDGDDYCTASPQHRWRERWTAEEFLADVTRYAPGLGIELPAGGLGDLVDVRVEARSRSGRVWRLRVSGTTGDLAIPSYAVRGVLRRGGRPDLILR